MAAINPRGWQAALQAELGVHHVPPTPSAASGCIAINTCIPAALLVFAAGACAGYLGHAYQRARQCTQAVEHADKATSCCLITKDDMLDHQDTCPAVLDNSTAQSHAATSEASDTAAVEHVFHNGGSPSAALAPHHRTDHPPSTPRGAPPSSRIQPPDPSTPPVLSETHRRMALLVESLGINVTELSAGEKVQLLGVTVDLWNAMTSHHQQHLALRYVRFVVMGGVVCI